MQRNRSKIINLTSKLPAFKKDLSIIRNQPLFFQHISSSERHIKLVILTYFLFKSILGDNIYKLKFFNFVIHPIRSLVAMHQLNKSRPADNSMTLKLEQCSFKDSKYFDEIIIGSGPGGAIAALNSIKNNKTTLIIEKGIEQIPHVHHHSLEQLVYFFNFGGKELIYSQKPILFAQGKVFGGGSEINSGLYHRLPEHIRNNWLQLLNVSESEWLLSEKEIENKLHINAQNLSRDFKEKSILGNISKYLNLPIYLIPRWRTYEKDFFIHYGMSNTYLKEFLKNGGIHLLNHEVTNIQFQNQNKLELTVLGPNCNHKIVCSHLTLSCGTVETPRLLEKSKLIDHYKLNFQFHLMSRIIAQFKHDVNDLRDIDPLQIWDSEFSYKFGASVSTEDILKGILNPSQLSNLDLKKIGSYYVSIIPIGKSGFFKIGKNIYPYYLMDKKTKMHMSNKLKDLNEALIAVGAIKSFFNPKEINYNTVHIFGSLPIGKSDLVDNLGQLKGFEAMIRISDASLLPTPPFVNPQGPLMVMANILSKKYENKND